MWGGGGGGVDLCGFRCKRWTTDHTSKEELEYNKAGAHSEFFIVCVCVWGGGVLALRLCIIYTWL